MIGEGNRVAHAAALAVAETPSEAYNPLFLHGPPGLGKTHLLGAIANYLRANAPGLSVRYTTAEHFTNEFVAALRSSGAEALQGAATETSTCSWSMTSSSSKASSTPRRSSSTPSTPSTRVAASSSSPPTACPSELSTLAARLRDRFEWGLTIPSTPRPATRLTVLQRLAREAGLDGADRDALSELAHPNRRQRTPPARRPHQGDRPRLADRRSRSAPS